MSEHEMTIGFIGNPNCGKTTLFNAYTGANLKVANWPGVTVEKVEGVMKDHDLTIHLVDLPGTYSLTSYTMEETVSRQFILSDKRKSRKVFRLPLSRHWNVPIKAIFSQAAGHFTQMAVCFQSVDEVSLTKYDEDTIKQ